MSGSTRVTRVTRPSRQTMSSTGIPPLPAPTWNRWATRTPPGRQEGGRRNTRKHETYEKRYKAGRRKKAGLVAVSFSFFCPPSLSSFVYFVFSCVSSSARILLLLRLRQRPFAGLVPDLVARQPAPGGLDGEDAGEARRVPPAAGARAALPPQAQRLPFEQVRAVTQ